MNFSSILQSRLENEHGLNDYFLSNSSLTDYRHNMYCVVFSLG